MISKLSKRVISLVVTLLFCVVSLYADVVFTANAPLLVSEGEPFPVEFVLNAKPKDNSFTPPAFDGFNVVAGPRVSMGSSLEVINGKMSRSTNYTYTFILMGTGEGNFVIPAAGIEVDNKRYTTQPTPIEVVKEQRAIIGAAQQQTTGTQQGATQQQSERERASNRIGEDDLFMRMTISRGSVYKGEPIYATIKLYSRVDIARNENLKLPTFNGFWAQDITDSRSRSASRENYNGRVYDTYVIKEYLLYPQQSGELTIEPAQIDITAQVVMQSRTNIDPFFGGGHELINVRRHLATEAMSVDVKHLPAGEPTSFSGAVGQFEIEMLPLASSTIEANSASTIKIRVSGAGNMTFIQAPKVVLPNSFELYNVRTTESINSLSSGASGYKEFEYPFIARAEGDYTIPSIEFSYFNPKSGAYNVVQTNPFSLSVTPDGNGTDSATVQRVSSKVNIEMLGRDIRFIKLGDGKLSRSEEPFVLSTLYFIIVGAILLLYVALYFVIRRAMRESKNQVLRRGKMANKMAVQRFKMAKGYMEEGREQLFYEEMLRGLWGYMSDKLNIPVANLTKEYVREELSKRGCSSDLVQEFSAIITICDEAQYSPMASSQMSEVYGRGLDFVSKIEAFVKRKK